MNSLLGDKLADALAEKKNDINSFIWKGPKREIGGIRAQSEKKLVDATPEELKSYFEHCQSMLYSLDKKYPGRYVLMKIVEEQRMKCNVELFLRRLENVFEVDSDRKAYPRFLFLEDIKKRINNDSSIDINDSISTLVDNIPLDYRDVTIKFVIEGCEGTLGIFDKSHISLNFITKLGVWFTDKEMNDLLEKTESGKVRNRMDVIKERLGIKNNIKLYPNFKGLHYSELRAMLTLKTKEYSELTTDQLVTLRNKVLFRFEDEIRFHISQWEELCRELELVARSKGFSLGYKLPDEIDKIDDK